MCLVPIWLAIATQFALQITSFEMTEALFRNLAAHRVLKHACLTTRLPSRMAFSFFNRKWTPCIIRLMHPPTSLICPLVMMTPYNSFDDYRFIQLPFLRYTSLAVSAWYQVLYSFTETGGDWHKWMIKLFPRKKLFVMVYLELRYIYKYIDILEKHTPVPCY